MLKMLYSVMVTITTSMQAHSCYDDYLRQESRPATVATALKVGRGGLQSYCILTGLECASNSML